MGRLGRACLVGVCVLLGIGALGSVATLGGCSNCGGAPCPSDTFQLGSVGRCIVAIDSHCKSAILATPGCGDAGAAIGQKLVSGAVVFPPDPVDGSAAATCDVRATFDDGTTIALNVQFTPHDTRCCGTVYEIDPPEVVLGAPVQDGGVDATDADAASDSASDM